MCGGGWGGGVVVGGAGGERPGKEDVRRFVTSLPSEVRPFHAHTAQAVAYDLWDAVAASRANRAQGLRARAPWREKKYRPLSFTPTFGWRVTPGGRLALSLGRGRGRIVLPMPQVTSRAGRPVAAARGPRSENHTPSPHSPHPPPCPLP